METALSFQGIPTTYSSTRQFFLVTAMEDNDTVKKKAVGPKQMTMTSMFMKTKDMMANGAKEIEKDGKIVIEHEGKTYVKTAESTFSAEELALMKHRREGK
jgi:hypothetical protein